jgi:hypothetical protein
MSIATEGFVLPQLSKEVIVAHLHGGGWSFRPLTFIPLYQPLFSQHVSIPVLRRRLRNL